MSQADQTHNGDSPLNTRDPWQLWAECGHVQSSAAGAPDETSPVEMSERVLNGSRKRPVSGFEILSRTMPLHACVRTDIVRNSLPPMIFISRSTPTAGSYPVN